MFFFYLITLIVVGLYFANRSNKKSEMEEKLNRLDKAFHDLMCRVSILEEGKENQSHHKPTPIEVRPVEIQRPIEKKADLPIEPMPPKPIEPLINKPVIFLPSQTESHSTWSPSSINWENFTGVKLFSWLGGFALFLGAAFFVKYSIDKGLLSPMVRVIMGFIVGTAAIVGGLSLRKKGYDVTVQTLCAAGISILYTDIFAAHSFFQFIGSTPAFLLMIIVTVLSFMLAVNLNSRYVAILGLVGGFLTPPLLSTGVDHALGLFSYIALLDLGLIALAYKKRWNFLLGMACAGTIAMQLGWAGKFFAVSKELTADAIFAGFSLLFMLVHDSFRQKKLDDNWTLWPAAIMPIVSLLFLFSIVSANATVGNHPGLLFGTVFLLGIMVSILATRSDKYVPTHLTSGVISFLVLLVWTTTYLSTGLLFWGLSFYFLFALLYGFYPVLLKKLGRTTGSFQAGPLFPLLMLGLILIAVMSKAALSFFIWPFVLLLSLTTIVISVILAVWWGALIAVTLTMALAGVWLFHMPDPSGLTGFLLIVGFFSLVFLAVGLFLKKKFPLMSFLPTSKDSNIPDTEQSLLSLLDITSLSTLMPFFLLVMASVQLALRNPSPIYGLALLLTVLVFGLVRYQKLDLLVLLAMVGTWAVQYVWFQRYFEPASITTALSWNLGFLLLYSLFPFVFGKEMKTRLIPWITSAAAGPLHFYLIYKSLLTVAGPAYIGALPFVFALFYLLLLQKIRTLLSTENVVSNTHMALFGAISLFFVTLIIPIQFEKEWITVGWVLEALALVWLFKRVPHEGLKIWSAGLFSISFIRLALNSAVLAYHARTANPIFNWYLYAYGIAALSFFMAARWWIVKGKNELDENLPAFLNVGGTILSFLLLNIEIADFYSEGTAITFKFSQNFAADLSYSLGWALFAVILLVVGIRTKSKGARYASLGLLSVTALKVFLHDLWQLGQLYRVGAFVGLAVVLMLVSFLYQRYIAKETDSHV